MSRRVWLRTWTQACLVFQGQTSLYLQHNCRRSWFAPVTAKFHLFDNTPTWANFKNARGNYAGNNGFGPMTENSPEENTLPRPHGGQPGVLYMNSNLKLAKDYGRYLQDGARERNHHRGR